MNDVSEKIHWKARIYKHAIARKKAGSLYYIPRNSINLKKAKYITLQQIKHMIESEGYGD